jgi:hypothetical protein
MPRDVGGLKNLASYYSTDLMGDDQVAVTAFVDPSVKKLCGILIPGKEGCIGCMTISPGELSAEQRQQLYDLRGKEGCFLVVQGGYYTPSQLVINEVIGSNCQPLRDRYTYQPKVDGRNPPAS